MGRSVAVGHPSMNMEAMMGKRVIVLGTAMGMNTIMKGSAVVGHIPMNILWKGMRKRFLLIKSHFGGILKQLRY